MSRGSRVAVVLAAGVSGALLLAGCAGSAGEESQQPAASTSTSAPAATPTPSSRSSATAAAEVSAGSYIDYAAYQQDPAKFAAGGDVVLFFNASWCPTCQAASANFSSQAVPNGLTVVSVDYDDNTALRQQYGVTVQHTFVQVDASGAQLAKWSGSTSFDQVAAATA